MNDPQPTTPTPPSRSLEWLPRWELVALFLGDFLALILFAVWGRQSHELLSSSASPFRAVFNTATPFMIAWLIVALFLGTYKATALYPLTRVLWKTTLAGLIAGPLGGVFWAILRGRWPTSPIFYVVTTLATLGILLIWRVLWSRLRKLWWPELP